MSNLIQLEANKNRLLADIIENYGEITEEQSEALESLSKDISDKVDSYAYLLGEKGLESTIDTLKGKIDDIKKEIEKIQKLKEYIQYQLNEYIEENGTIELDLDGTKRYISKDLSVRSEIDYLKIPENKKQYKIKLPRLTYNQMQDLVGYLELQSDIQGYDLDSDMLISYVKTHMPEAIVNHVRPTIKITKKKPKDSNGNKKSK